MQYDWDKADEDAAAERPLWMAKKAAAAQAPKLTTTERNKLELRKAKERARAEKADRAEMEKAVNQYVTTE